MITTQNRSGYGYLHRHFARVQVHTREIATSGTSGKLLSGEIPIGHIISRMTGLIQQTEIQAEGLLQFRDFAALAWLDKRE